MRRICPSIYSCFLRQILLGGVLLAGLLGGAATALEVEGLYQVEVPVADQSPNKRWAAVLTGFKEVLIRKSGSGRVLTTHEVKQAYSKVTAYLQRFEYANVADQDSDYPYRLLLDFEPRLIDELIQEAGMPIWGDNRPVTIVWLATEQDYERQLVVDDASESGYSSMLTDAAKRRGIPLILPLMDLEDQLNVSISDVWGMFSTPVVNASQRYAADSIVSGRIVQNGEQWQARVVYINQNAEQIFEVTDASPELVVQGVADRVAEKLCEKYCVVEMAQSHQITMQVSNVGNFASFKSLQGYLESLSSIRSVKLDKIAATHVRFKIAMLGDLQSVKDGLSLDVKLVEEAAPLQDPFAAPLPVAEEETTENQTSEKQNLDMPELVPQEQAEPMETNLEFAEPIILYYRWAE